MCTNKGGGRNEKERQTFNEFTNELFEFQQEIKQSCEVSGKEHSTLQEGSKCVLPKFYYSRDAIYIYSSI